MLLVIGITTSSPTVCVSEETADVVAVIAFFIIINIFNLNENTDDLNYSKEKHCTYKTKHMTKQMFMDSKKVGIFF